MYCIGNATVFHEGGTRFEIWLILYPSCAYRALSPSVETDVGAVPLNRQRPFVTTADLHPVRGHFSKHIDSIGL